MCDTINKKSNNSGFSLVELSIVLVIIGVVLTPALGAYSLYKKNQLAEQTRGSVAEARNAIEDFRSIYGRYPCPARMDAVQGDADYGYESRNAGTGECTAVAGGVLTANSNNAGLTDDDVFMGSLPFRKMNLSDTLIHDGYNNQITYAVTGQLANTDPLDDPEGGGITLIDLDGNSVTELPDAVHFIILSHSESDQGARDRSGSVVGVCPAATPEEENCNFDATFRTGSAQEDFDDIVHYNTYDSVEQWQISAISNQNIHLRIADSMSVGFKDESGDTSAFETLELQDNFGDATIEASADPANFLNGAFLSDQLCSYDGTRCFSPKLIGGQIGQPGEGMDCSPDFLVGVENGAPVCASEITFSCPNGTFVSGFDASGKIVCDVQPPLQCADDTLTATCGDNRNVSAFFYNGDWYGYAYSGECYKIANLDTAHLATLTSIADVQAYVDGLNNAARTATDCGPDTTTAMVRDTFKCESGAWNPTPVNKLERIALTNNNLASFSALYNGGYYPAEVSGASYNSAAPMSVDPNNTAYNRDCWCREDYRVIPQACGGAAVGQKFIIRKHRCPQTAHQWQNVYPTSGWDTSFCGCVPGQTTSAQSCKSYFGYSGSGIIGNAIHTYDITCPSGPNGAPLKTLNNTDISDCKCPDYPKAYAPINCPFGYTNSFSYAGTGYTGVNQLYEKTWSCPSGPAPTPATSAADAGSYGPYNLVHTEPCVCNVLTPPKVVTKTCLEVDGPGYQGAGYQWTLNWDCGTGAYEAPSASNLDFEDCHKCIWQTGTPRPGLQETAAPVAANADCPSCSGTSACYEPQSGQFKVWDGCYCAGQP